MRKLLAFLPALMLSLLAFTLAACHLMPERPPAPVLHDLGTAPSAGLALTWRPQLQVTAPPWLDGGAVHYRLPDGATQLAAYRGHRWVAPPSQLLAQRLQLLLAPPAPAAPVRMVEIDLQGFEQRFQAAGGAEAALAARVTLLERRGGPVIASRDFTLAVPCASADVDGGVAAMAAGMATLALDIGQWLTSAATAPP
ncbi:MAG: ABC-type transport auxiliary lipoprotein family protein [Porticoccaceae bacterium]